MYTLRYSNDALADIQKLKKNEPKAVKKLISLLNEIQMHPRSGTGQAERLKHYEGEVWSRRLTQRHRLVYRVLEDCIEVLILSSYGHY